MKTFKSKLQVVIIFFTFIILFGVFIFKSNTFNLNFFKLNTLSINKNYESYYHFKIDSEGKLNLDSSNQNENFELKTNFNDIVRVQWNNSENLIYIKWIPHLKISINNQSLIEQENVLKEVLSHEMALKLSDEGLPQVIYYQNLKNITPEALDIIVNNGKMILLQLAWNKNQTFSNIGIDIWGSHKQSWSSDNNSFILSTISVDKTESGLNGKAQIQLSFNNKGYLKELNGHQELLAGKNFSLGQSSIDYAISELEDPSASPHNLNPTSQAAKSNQIITASTILKGHWKATINDFEEDAPWININSKVMKKATLEARTKNWTIDKILNEAEILIKSGKTSMNDLMPLSQLLEDLLWLDEEKAESYAQWAIKIGIDHPLYNEILKAMIQVGGPYSQRALEKILNNFIENEKASTQLILSMAFLKNPDLQTQSTLEDLAEQGNTSRQKTTAQLSLGQMAYQLNETDPSRSEDILIPYWKEIENPSDPQKTKLALNVIGNSGNCTNWNVLQIYLNSSNSELYTRALEAIRFCKKSEVSQIYWQTFSQKEHLQKFIVELVEMRLNRNIKDNDLKLNFENWLKIKSNQSKSIARSISELLTKF